MDLGLEGEGRGDRRGEQGYWKGDGDPNGARGGERRLLQPVDRLTAGHRERDTGFGGTCLPIECDLSEQSAAARFVAETVQAFGRLDIAVFTPSLHVSREFLDLTDDEWQQSYDITFHSAVRFTRGCDPHMQAQGGGRIVLVAAGSVYKQSVGIGIGHRDVHPDFTTAKAALTNLSKFLSKTLASTTSSSTAYIRLSPFPPKVVNAGAASRR